MGKKTLAKDLFPMPCTWGWSKKERKEQWKEFKDSMDTIWDHCKDMQKADRKAQKEQWNTFVSQFLEMEQTVADSIPEDAPTMPGMPAPKEFIEKMKEYQETAHKHAMEQVDNALDLMAERQQKAKEALTDAVQNIEDKIDKYQSDDDEEEEKPAPVEVDEPAEKPAKAAAKKPAAKRRPKPAAKPAAKPEVKPEEKPAEN